ncbi:hypothetical protein PHISCL_07937 [Aspergillus sclerotialis]|uniref:AMP-dependent synthetase/ligase domain-containing protein n=1 Tax=Aspergillus sclerotialis TaxID=2070753 RepID=A0A3A2ZK29_9EURO|nr:hypothetical protein PHISCL_07937 [Aspergillus sclerotialis]
MTPETVQSSLHEHIQFVRARSPYYKKLYSSLPSTVRSLEDVPIVNNSEYWKASNAEPSQVLTDELVDAVVMRSGGLTSEPKTVYMTRQEFHETSRINGLLAPQSTGLLPGDRIANLSSQGGMYSGFMTAPGKYRTDIRRFKATVVISNVFVATRLARYLVDNDLRLASIRLILYTGELFYQDLRKLYQAAFPFANIGPLAYAAVECKVIAFPASPTRSGTDDDINPVYRVNTAAVIMEIIGPDGTVIKGPGQRGNVVVTNLIKRLQPTIRYPVGDVGEWVDYENGLFRLRGRDTVGLKIGTALLDLPLIRRLIGKALGDGMVGSCQAVVRRQAGKNQVVFRIAAPQPRNQTEKVRIEKELEEGIIAVNPSWARNREEGFIAPVQTEWVLFSKLVFLESSGKLKEIVDERYCAPNS